MPNVLFIALCFCYLRKNVVFVRILDYHIETKNHQEHFTIYKLVVSCKFKKT